MYSEKLLKTIKLLASPFLVMSQILFTHRAVKEGHLDTQVLKALGHFGTRALEALGQSKGTLALRQSKHLRTWALRYLGTLALGHLKGTWALQQSGSWALEALYFAVCLFALVQPV